MIREEFHINSLNIIKLVVKDEVKYQEFNSLNLESEENRNLGFNVTPKF